MTDLTELARRVREHPGLIAKRGLRHVAETVGGDGDDAAVVAEGGVTLVAAAEAIRPDLIRADPRVAGIAGVVTVLNDVAATGGRPTALLNTVVGPDAIVRGMLDGIALAAALYGVPVVGGHTTVHDGDVGLSTFAFGAAAHPLRASNVRPGDALFLVTSSDGEMVSGPDGSLFFSHLRGSRRAEAAADLARLADAADAGIAWAARDVSMPGLVGSLIQFAESAGGLGCAIAIDDIPVPHGAQPDDWIMCFPSFAFFVVGDVDRVAAHFGAAGLLCAQVGTFDGSGLIRLRRDNDTADVWDLTREPLAALVPTGRDE